MINPAADYDSPWKDTLEWYFEPFIALCFAHIHSQINWSRPSEFLDKELQKVVRDAEVGRRWADKLVKVWLNNGQETWILIHVEVQGKKQTEFAKRMYTYHHRISGRYNRPVASLAVLSDANPQWRPTQYSSEIFGCKIQFNFLMVKLLDYKQQWPELEQSANPFATVIMAHLKAVDTRSDGQQRKIWKMALTRRLYEQGYQRQDILNLYHFIDWVMHLPSALEQAFREEVNQYEQEVNMKYVTSIERLGIKQGRQEGRQEGILEGRQEGAERLLLRLLQRRFGDLSPEIQARVKGLSVEKLEHLMDVAIDVDSLEQLADHLPAPEAAN
ncbi:DUF4351 domain-containing protein [Moorena sp. SIO3E8]|uniref:DUF4351 domain-containing protein n=1 Tax=Moorena sp. SIO3E8 TaxID=2607830 RepID=UPI0014186085|nr:DUF4351 domain-containing protein [Moorena sp. SIO3E8]NEO11989.1 DUF4351 domain-containing protein [Moorena sp. SIO3E8]